MEKSVNGGTVCHFGTRIPSLFPGPGPGTGKVVFPSTPAFHWRGPYPALIPPPPTPTQQSLKEDTIRSSVPSTELSLVRLAQVSFVPNIVFGAFSANQISGLQVGCRHEIKGPRHGLVSSAN